MEPGSRSARRRRRAAVTWAFWTRLRRPVVPLTWKGGNVAAGCGAGQGGSAVRVRVRRAGWSAVVRGIVVQHEEVGSRGVGDHAERVQALRVEGLLRREDAVGADGELRDVGVLAGIRRGAVGAAGGGRAPVQNIKKAAAGEQDGANRVGAAGGDRQTVDGVSLPVL